MNFITKAILILFSLTFLLGSAHADDEYVPAMISSHGSEPIYESPEQLTGLIISYWNSYPWNQYCGEVWAEGGWPDWSDLPVNKKIIVSVMQGGVCGSGATNSYYQDWTPYCPEGYVFDKSGGCLYVDPTIDETFDDDEHGFDMSPLCEEINMKDLAQPSRCDDSSQCDEKARNLLNWPNGTCNTAFSDPHRKMICIRCAGAYAASCPGTKPGIFCP